MRLTNFREAPLLHANLLLNAELKTPFKSLPLEISKMSSIFGSEFDKSLYKTLFDQINFKSITLQSSKNPSTQFFLQTFPHLLLRSDFTEFFSLILMDTTNPSTPIEIFDSLNQIFKLPLENQLTLLLSFIFSDRENFVIDAQKMLLFKCKEIQKEDNFSQLTDNTIQTLLLVLRTFESNQTDAIDIANDIQLSLTMREVDEIKDVKDVNKMLEIGTEEQIEIEKIFSETGPMMVNNIVTSSKVDFINYDMDEKRLAGFVLYIITHQTWEEDMEKKQLNYFFLRSIKNDNWARMEVNNEKKTLPWDIENIYKMYQKKIDGMDKGKIINAFDDPKFVIKDKKDFDFFISTLQKLKILNNANMFFNFIFTKWTNELNQIEFLWFLINNSQNCQQSESYSFKSYTGKKVKKSQEVINAITSKSPHLIDAWSCIELVEVLLNLSKGNYYIKVKDLFDWPIQNIPEILILSLTSIKPDKSVFLYDELLMELLPTFLSNHQSSTTIIEEIWVSNKDLIVKTLSNLYESQPDLMNLSRIFDISQKMKDSLLLMVHCNDFNFAVNLGLLAAKRDFLHMDQWLKDSIDRSGDDFIGALINYIKINLIVPCKSNASNKDNILEKAQLTLESLRMILDNLIKANSTNKVSNKMSKEIKEVYKSIFEIFVVLQSQPVNSEEVKKSVNNSFKSLFNGETTVNELIDKLIQYQNSTIPEEVEFYACTIYNILDEYRFYHQYPDKELSIQATLFGQLINHKLFDGIFESIALKYIQEALKKGSGPLFLFGTIALSQFIDKIHFFPTYLAELLEIKKIRNSQQALYDRLVKKYRERQGGKGDNASTSRKGSSISSISNKDSNVYLADSEEGKSDEVGKSSVSTIGNGGSEITEVKCGKIKTKLVKPSTQSGIGNILTLLEKEKDGSDNQSSTSQLTQPPQKVIDTLNAVFVSMSKSNVNEKSKELKTILDSDSIIKWFSNFFIVNRVSNENNNHQIYNELISLVDNKNLNKFLIKDTIYYIKKLLSNESLDKEPKRKNLLKNLGSWLGIMTLSKEKPILAKDLDLKEILINAYENGKLSVIINFVVRIMEHTAKTKIFHSKNPWVQAILSLLSELYAIRDLKENLKYEIKNLFKKLSLDISTYPQGKLLNNYKMNINSQDFTKEKSLYIDYSSVQKSEFYSKVESLDNLNNDIVEILSKATMNSKGQSISITKNEIVYIMTKCLTNITNEIINQDIKKYSDICIVTTREILLKDFVFEKNEHKLQEFAFSCAKLLVSSLCFANFREQIKNKVNEAIRNELNKRKIDDKVIKKVIERLQSENAYEYFDIGYKVIQYTGRRKVIEKIKKDNKINEEIEKRKQNKSDDKKKDIVNKMNELPEMIRPNENGLNEDQFKIYENYDKLYGIFNQFNGGANNSFLYIVYKMVKEVFCLNTANIAAKITKNYEICMFNIHNIFIDKNPNFNGNEVEMSFIEEPILESRIDDFALANECAIISLKYCIIASKNSIDLLLDIYSQLITGWIKLHEEISTEITQHLLSYEEVLIRFNPDIQEIFLRKQILSISLYETHLIEFFNKEPTRAVARRLINELYKRGAFKEEQLQKIHPYMYNEYSNDYFSLFYKNSKINLSFNNNNNGNSKESQANMDKEITDMQNCPENKQSIEKLNEGIDTLYSLTFGFEQFKLDEGKKLLISIIAQNNICSFIMKVTKKVINESENVCIYTPEGEAKLINQILELVRSCNNINKLKFFDNVLFGIFKVFHQDYINNTVRFNQRPYYKLLYNLIYILDKYGTNDNIWDSGYKKVHFLMLIADFLKILSPNNYPAFSLAWLDLISSKVFIVNFLEDDQSRNQKETKLKHEKYLIFLNEVSKFLCSFRNTVISDYSCIIFLDNVLKFIFLLCVSFPYFIAGYYSVILSWLPYGNCFTQMKNLILCCSIRNEQIKDIDIIGKNAVILFDITQNLNDTEIKGMIDKYVECKSDRIIDDIVNKINGEKNGKDESFYIINDIVVYWSHNVVKIINEKTCNNNNNSNLNMFEFFEKLIVSLNGEKRDHLINGILNELRYPSNQTNYFANLVIHIFFEIKNEEIEEHIMKNVAERLLYNPHPWGLEEMFINLESNIKFSKMEKNYMNEDTLEKLIGTCKGDK